MEEILVAIALLFAFIIILQPSRRSRPAQNPAAMAEIEGKVDALLQKAGVLYDPGASLPPGVANALQRGQKIEAIKLYRAATGVGLKEAKDFIEGAGGTLHVQNKLDALLKNAGIAYTPRYRPQYRASGSKGSAVYEARSNTASGAKGAIAPEAMAEVQTLIRAGNMIGAIKRYREITGVGLKEAKDAVEAIQRNGI